MYGFAQDDIGSVWAGLSLFNAECVITDGWGGKALYKDTF